MAIVMLNTGLMLAVDESAGMIELDGVDLVALHAGGLALTLRVAQIVGTADDPAALRPFYIPPVMSDVEDPMAAIASAQDTAGG